MTAAHTRGTDRDRGRDVVWCRLCEEQPAQMAVADGVCGFCRGDVAEGRVIDPDAGSTTDTVLLGVSGLGIVVGAVGVLVGAWHLDPVTFTAALAILGAYGWLAARMYGICRACGHPGSAGDPLTTVSRLRGPRVHTRHVATIRASVRASREAAAAARVGDGSRAELRPVVWVVDEVGYLFAGDGGRAGKPTEDEVVRAAAQRLRELVDEAKTRADRITGDAAALDGGQGDDAAGGAR
jgi:hypothetical protein